MTTTFNDVAALPSPTPRKTPTGHQKRVATRNESGMNNKSGTRGVGGRFASAKTAAKVAGQLELEQETGVTSARASYARSKRKDVQQAQGEVHTGAGMEDAGDNTGATQQ